MQCDKQDKGARRMRKEEEQKEGTRIAPFSSFSFQPSACIFIIQQGGREKSSEEEAGGVKTILLCRELPLYFTSRSGHIVGTFFVCGVHRKLPSNATRLLVSL